MITILTRVFLLLAILASGAALFFVNTSIPERIKAKDKAIEDGVAALAKKDTENKKLTGDLTATKDDLDKSSADNVRMKAEVEDAKKKEADAAAKVAKAESDAQKARAEVQKAKDENKELTDLNKSPAEIREAFAQVIKLREEKFVAEAERKLLYDGLARRSTELANLKGSVDKVMLPPGLKGKITVVDPKWAFVMVNVGGNQGMLPGGEMIVHRDERMLGRIKITQVEANYSIGNIALALKKDEIIEGDSVAAAR